MGVRQRPVSKERDQLLSKPLTFTLDKLEVVRNSGVEYFIFCAHGVGRSVEATRYLRNLKERSVAVEGGMLNMFKEYVANPSNFMNRVSSVPYLVDLTQDDEWNSSQNAFRNELRERLKNRYLRSIEEVNALIAMKKYRDIE